MPSFVTSTPFFAVAVVVIIILILAFVASRYKVAGANEAIIVAGSRGAKVRDERGQSVSTSGDKGVKVVVGGGTIVMPLLNRVGRLKLTARQINVQLSDAVTSQGIKVQVQGVATFKIGRDVESLRNAAERFLDAKPEQVDSIVKNVLEGSLRSIVGTLTIEELIRDRQKLLQQVQDAAKGDLATSGLQIDAFTIQSFSDESNYIELLGQQSVSTVTRDARMVKATTDQEAAVREAEAQQVKINAARDVSLREAETKTQVAAAQARADQAGPLAQAEAQQEVVRKQTELAQLAAERKEMELLSSTVKPAAADAQAVIAKAEGDKRARIASAEADAETTRLEGGAEAQIVLTKGEAEAKALAMRADAYKQFNEAAIIQTVLAALPEIVRAAAEPMGHIDSLTVMSADGASDIVRNATRAMIESTTAIKGLTGLDVPNLIGGALGRGFGERLRTGDGEAGSDSGSAADRISEIAGEGLSALKAQRVEAAARAETAAHEAATKAAADAEKVAEKAAEEAAKAKAVAGALKAAGAADRPAAAAPKPAVAGTAQPWATVPQTKPGAAVESVAPSEGNIAQWGKWLADRLREVPNIQLYDALTLNDLASRGPAPARAVWNTAQAVLGKDYGSTTVADLLKRFTQ
ncbi:MAG TPA: SPFH domain-containing protein [Candidatus Dormibacteraeota bacterium]|nr:SPFH domain-containing protein [Candidatus Dormibacteraeota bacterium]